MLPTVVLVPAYGRSYSTKKAVLVDWLAGKDFRIEAGPYTSIRDLDALRKEYVQIAFKYGKQNCKYFYLTGENQWPTQYSIVTRLAIWLGSR